MKNFLTTLLAILLLSSVDVYAQNDDYLNVGINFRTDAYNYFSNKKETISKIDLNTLTLIFYGTVYPGITYKFQQRLNDSPFLESDKYTSSIEDAWFNFAMEGWKWDFKVGKQDILFGTFESDYDPSDMYLISMVFDNFNRSQVGVTARYTWPLGNTLGFQISNVRGRQLAYNENHSFAYTVNARQHFFSDCLNTTLAYTLIQSGKGRYYSWFTLGSRLIIKNNFIEMDAYAGRYQQNMTMDADEDNYREADSFSVSVTERHRINKFIIFAKAAYDYQQEVKTNEMSKRSIGAALGVEYYPIPNQDLRVHAVYTLRHHRYGEPWLDRQGNVVTNLITLGLKWEVNLARFLNLRK